MKVKKKRVETMLEFEGILNEYLAGKRPLALLEEEYALTTRQRGFYINRLLSYETNYDRIDNMLGNIEDVKPGEEYLFMSHSIEEKTPLVPEKQKKLFERMQELREQLKFTPDEEEIFQNDDVIKSLEEEKKAYNESDIELIKTINSELSKFDENDDVIQDELEASILTKYNISEDDYNKLNDLYDAYNYVIKRIINRKNELRSANSVGHYEILEREYENLRNEIVCRNIKLANWVVRRFFKYVPFEMEEAQAVALEGLVKAINSFDPSRGGRFSTYATVVIRHNITNRFKELTGVKWDEYLQSLEYEKYKDMYSQLDPSKKFVTANDIYESGISGLSYSDLKSIEDIVVRNVVPATYAYPQDPLDEKTNIRDFLKTFEEYEREDEYLDEVESFIEENDGVLTDDDPIMVTENKALLLALSDEIQTILSTLNDQEKIVLIKRFGLDGNQPQTLEGIGKLFNVSRTRISQIEEKALRKLRHPSRAKKIRDFVSHEYNSGYYSNVTIEDILTSMFNYEINNGRSPLMFPDERFRNLFNVGYKFDTDKIKEKYERIFELITKLPKDSKYTLRNKVNEAVGVDLPMSFYYNYLINMDKLYGNSNRSYY